MTSSSCVARWWCRGPRLRGGASRCARPQAKCPLRTGHLSVRDQGRQDQIVPAQDEDLPFVLNVESAFRITGRGTVVMGVIDQGTLHIGDHLEVSQPGSVATAAASVPVPRCRPSPAGDRPRPCAGISDRHLYRTRHRAGGDPSRCQATSRRAISGPLTTVKSGLSRSLADSLPRRSGHVTGPDGTASQADRSG